MERKGVKKKRKKQEYRELNRYRDVIRCLNWTEKPSTSPEKKKNNETYGVGKGTQK